MAAEGREGPRAALREAVLRTRRAVEVRRGDPREEARARPRRGRRRATDGGAAESESSAPGRAPGCASVVVVSESGDGVGRRCGDEASGYESEASQPAHGGSNLRS